MILVLLMRVIKGNFMARQLRDSVDNRKTCELKKEDKPQPVYITRCPHNLFDIFYSTEPNNNSPAKRNGLQNPILSIKINKNISCCCKLNTQMTAHTIIQNLFLPINNHQLRSACFLQVCFHFYFICFVFASTVTANAKNRYKIQFL